MPVFDRTAAQEVLTGRTFRCAVSAWANRDLDAVMRTMSDDVVHNLNVDGTLVPFAASVTGKAALREKLQLMLDTFEFGAFVTEGLKIDGSVARAQIKIIYIHFGTGERLNVSFRFIVEQRDGLIVRMDEFHDAAYLEAFVRLVSMPRPT